jgi:hypothetical protein
VSHRPAGAEPELVELLDEARAACGRSLSAGGNRFTIFTPPPRPEPVKEPAPVAAPVAPVLDVWQLTRALEQVLSTRVKELFESMGEKVPDFGGHEREVMELAVKKLTAEKARRENEQQSQIELLQRRLAKLGQSLELTEEELRRVMAAKSIDPGVASIYRTVQGLSVEQADAELKKEMMAKIFEANFELRKQLGGGPA